MLNKEFKESIFYNDTTNLKGYLYNLWKIKKNIVYKIRTYNTLRIKNNKSFNMQNLASLQGYLNALFENKLIPYRIYKKYFTFITFNLKY